MDGLIDDITIIADKDLEITFGGILVFDGIKRLDFCDTSCLRVFFEQGYKKVKEMLLERHKNE
ncbi:MAG: hypothetical protein A2W22_03050 [Candidatus Levybacteria bacterium RBG_16_35_11]|nr:MAG: hypothetical protein A2W22_03050 [Candidatus Levybacteria bacterium RBG_16_35_11]